MIIDASVAIKWVVPEPDSDLAHSIVHRPDLVAPESLDWEVGHVLTRLSRSRRMLKEDAQAAWAGLIDNPMKRVPSGPHLGKAFELSLRLHASFQDCVYLAVAIAHGDVVITADQGFLRASAAAGLSSRVIALAATVP